MVVTLDADMFGDWPGSIPYARGFTHQRKADAPSFSNRLYALETTPGLTGAYADNRLALPPAEIEKLAWRLAARLGVPAADSASDAFPAADGDAKRWEAALATQLLAHRGRSLVVAGGALSPQTRALAHLLNAHLGNTGNTLIHIKPVEAAADQPCAVDGGAGRRDAGGRGQVAVHPRRQSGL